MAFALPGLGCELARLRIGRLPCDQQRTVPGSANPRQTLLVKVSLGRAEGLNNKIRVIQRSGYGCRDEAYLKLRIITSFLLALPPNVRLHPH